MVLAAHVDRPADHRDTSVQDGARLADNEGGSSRFIRWRSGEAREGVSYRLPLEREWEKAARGADRRVFPWGDRFDATVCKMRYSRPGRPQPEPVGAFATDVSVYGARDLAGSMREWCGDETFDGDPARRLVRGGSWLHHPRICRAANRFGFEPWFVSPNIGFRVVRAVGSPRGPRTASRSVP